MFTRNSGFRMPPGYLGAAADLRQVGRALGRSVLDPSDFGPASRGGRKNPVGIEPRREPSGVEAETGPATRRPPAERSPSRRAEDSPRRMLSHSTRAPALGMTAVVALAEQQVQGAEDGWERGNASARMLDVVQAPDAPNFSRPRWTRRSTVWVSTKYACAISLAPDHRRSAE